MKTKGPTDDTACRQRRVKSSPLWPPGTGDTHCPALVSSTTVDVASSTCVCVCVKQRFLNTRKQRRQNGLFELLKITMHPPCGHHQLHHQRCAACFQQRLHRAGSALLALPLALHATPSVHPYAWQTRTHPQAGHPLHHDHHTTEAGRHHVRLLLRTSCSNFKASKE